MRTAGRSSRRALEDYGLTPLEAAAYGKPTLALGAGGYLDTVVPGMTGLFFGQATPIGIRTAVLAGRPAQLVGGDDPRHTPSQFSEPVFRAALQRAVADLVNPSLVSPADAAAS